ncbi:MAG TPA: hypothetical protein VGO95_10915 [Modestobacter sp.]|nr:hypothetical protein [Modestobacter sp.]
MSQSHPPIPEPQPHPDPDQAPQAPPEHDEPRTQSILLPPSQRQTDDPVSPAAEPVDAPSAEPGQDWAPSPPPEQPLPGQPAPGPATGQFAQPAYQPDYDPTGPTQVTGPVDFVPGFSSEPPPVMPGGGAHATPPLSPRPFTAPGTVPASPPSSPPSSPRSTPRRSPLAAVRRAGRGRSALVPLGLGVLALVLLELGLARDYGTQSLWEVVPTWSALATVAALVVLTPVVAGLTGRFPARAAWRAGAAGAAALAAFWVLVALPLAASDRGFWLTAALAAAAASLWFAPGRKE